MGVIDTMQIFKDTTGVNIFDAIELEGILLGMGFITDELGLAEAINNDSGYLDKVEKLRQSFIKRKQLTEHSLTDKNVIEAIKQSLNNCIIGLKRFRKDFRYSGWLLDDYEAKRICSMYSDVLNPLVSMTISKPMLIEFKSIFSLGGMRIEHYIQKNGMASNGRQRTRKSFGKYKKGRYQIIGDVKVWKDLYHPIVWHLLRLNLLESYLTPSVLKEIKVYVSDLQDKVINK